MCEIKIKLDSQVQSLCWENRELKTETAYTDTVETELSVPLGFSANWIDIDGFVFLSD